MARGKKKETILTQEEKLQEALVPESEWPYKVPENWRYYRINGLATHLKRGKAPKYVKQSNILVFAQKCNQKDGTIAMEKAQFLNPEIAVRIKEDEFLKDEDVLVNSTGTGTLGRVGYYRSHYALPYLRVLPDSHMTVIRALSIVSPKYLYYYLKSKQEYLELQGVGTTNQKELRPEAIGNTIIPLPPLPEQQRIVDRIESLFAKLDEAKEKAQVVVDGFEDRRTMILHKAFTGELTANWRRAHNINMTSWKQLTLDEVADYKKGPFGSSITKAMFVPKGEHTYKVYEQGNAIRKTLDYGHYYISEQKYNELKGFAVKGGDIIISCAGTIGEVYKLPEVCEAGVINQALMRVRLYSIINERFFSYYFGEVIKGDVIDQANGTAIKNIPPFKIMKAMEIQLPTLLEQEEIVDLLDDMLRKEEQAQEFAEQVIAQIDTMKKSILARAFRGDLGTNDPSDESAEELLKKIL